MTDDTMPEGAVRGLEWEPFLDSNEHHAAYPVVGIYSVMRTWDKQFSCEAPEEETPGPGSLEIGQFRTMEEAKAAAQADYECRILSALTPEARAALAKQDAPDR